MLWYRANEDSTVVVLELKYKLLVGWVVRDTNGKYMNNVITGDKYLRTTYKSTFVKTLIEMGFKPIEDLYDIDYEVHYKNGLVSKIKFLEG